MARVMDGKTTRHARQLQMNFALGFSELRVWLISKVTAYHQQIM